MDNYFKEIEKMNKPLLNGVIESFILCGVETDKPSVNSTNADRVVWIKETAEQLYAVPYTITEDRVEEFDDKEVGDLVLVSFDDYEAMQNEGDGAEVTERKGEENVEMTEEEKAAAERSVALMAELGLLLPGLTEEERETYLKEAEDLDTPALEELVAKAKTETGSGAAKTPPVTHAAKLDGKDVEDALKTAIKSGFEYEGRKVIAFRNKIISGRRVFELDCGSMGFTVTKDQLAAALQE